MKSAITLMQKGLWDIKRYGVKQTAKKVVRWIGRITSKYDSNYIRWQAYSGTIRQNDIIEMKEMVKEFKYKPLISIVVPVYNPNPEFLIKMIDSIRYQVYTRWELCMADDMSTDPKVVDILKKAEKKDNRIKVIYRTQNGNISAASNSALELASGEYVALVDHDDIVPCEALFYVCYYINKYNNNVDLLYTDEDKLDGKENRYNPYFKCDWNRELIYQENYIAHLGVYRKSIIDKIKGFRLGFEGSQDYDLLLRFIKNTTDERIVHIPYVLYHWRKYESHRSFSTRFQQMSDRSAYRALKEFVGGKAKIYPANGLTGCWDVRWHTERRPLVSIIIPTHNKVSLLKNCVDGLLNNTSYSNIEIIIIDNNSSEDSTKRYLERIGCCNRVKVITDKGPFNYSRLNNEGVRVARGELVLLLNNDTEVCDKNWLTILVNTICEENVGIVGPKLLYGDNTVQHVGVTTGIYEVAGHPMRHLSKDNVGYFGWAVLTREVSAVTGACLLVWKHIYNEVNGLDEELFSVSFNDVDFCLKVREAGYRVVCNPHSIMMHLESQSRGDDITSEQKMINYIERRNMHQKYGYMLKFDKYYNPNLSLSNENIDLSDMSRIGKPWRDWIEFVCPFHRGDVLVGIQIAYTAVLMGKKIRMHVSKDIYEWIQSFPYKQYFDVCPVDVPIPNAIEAESVLEKAIALVANREDSSGRVVSVRPKRDLDKMGLDLVEFILEELELPIDTKLENLKPISCGNDTDMILNDFFNNLDSVVLLHPYGGWSLKSMPESIIKKIADTVHESGYKLIQIGGSNDKKAAYVDGYLLENISLSSWQKVFLGAKAIIGVDSWSSHFGAIINANQVVVYGSTSSRDVESKRHFVDQGGRYLKFETECADVPCHKMECKYAKVNRNKKYCNGMSVDKKKLMSFLQDV